MKAVLFPDRCILVRFLLLASAALARPVLAEGALATFGVDARSHSMAQAQGAYASALASVHYNPANVDLDGGRDGSGGAFLLQLSSMLPDLEVVTARAPSRESTTPRLPASRSGLLLGALLPLRGLWDDRIHAGFLFFAPTDTAAYISAPDPITPFFYRYDSATAHVEVELAASFRWWRHLSTGIGMRMGAGQEGRVDVALDLLQRRITAQSFAANQSTIWAPTAGIRLGPLALAGWEWTLGASYREQLEHRVAMTAWVDLEGLDTQVAVPIHLRANFSPRTFRVGTAAMRAGEEQGQGSAPTFLAGRSVVSADLVYAQWSAAPHPYVDMTATFSGTGVDALSLQGALDLPGPGQARVGPVGLRDTVSLHAGLEQGFWLDRVLASAGYFWRPTPVPDQVSGANLLDATLHGFSAGVRARWPLLEGGRVLEWAASWQMQSLQPRITRKLDGADPVGDWKIRGAMHAGTLSATVPW